MRIACFAAAAALVLAAYPARANGRFPASNQILFSPSDASLVVARTSYGILVSHDTGTTWDWLCEDTLGLPPTSTEDPFLGVTAGGAMIAGLSSGLQVSPDTGCSWRVVVGALDKQLVKDIVVRGDAPHAAVAFTSTYVPPPDDASAGTYSSRLYESSDDGANWTPLGTPVDPTALTTAFDVARTDPNRIYVSAVRGSGSQRTASLFVSTDGAAHWTEHSVPFDPNVEAAVYVAGVDPTDADRVYLRTSGRSRLLVSTDGGKSAAAVYALTDQMLGFALSPDGSKVWIGGPKDRLLEAARADLKFAPKAPIRVQCLAARASELWACSDEPSGFVVGVSVDDGASFGAKLHLNGLRGPLQCPSNSTAAMCASLFPALCDNVGCSGGDGGGDDGSSDAGGVPPPSTAHCGCTTTGGGGAFGAVAAAAACLGIARAARRGRR